MMSQSSYSQVQLGGGYVREVRLGVRRWFFIVLGLVCAVAVIVVALSSYNSTGDTADGGGQPVPAPATDSRAPDSQVGSEVWRLVKVELASGDDQCIKTTTGVEYSFRPESAESDAGVRGPRPLPWARVGPTKGIAKGGADGPNEVVTQPVEFSHDEHVVRLGVDCRYCHILDTASHFVHTPPTKSCMNCHQQIPGGAAKAEPGGATEVRRRWFVVRRDAGKSPKEIDLTECDADGRVLSGAVVRQGIYDESPTGLVIALPYAAAAGFRPKGFRPTAPVSAGVAVLHLAK
jgi:hypothetical protein